MWHGPRVQGDGSIPGSGPLWGWNGNFEKPTVTPSVRAQWTEGEAMTPKCCHFFLTDGKLHFLNDCTHALAGQVVDLPEMDG